jgi:phage gpG-like protein
MSAIGVEIVNVGLEDALLKIEGIADAPFGELMDGIGRLVQGQTRRRIASEKTSPDGTAWKDNLAGSGVLHDSGALYDSIDYQAFPNGVLVGSGLVYSRIHQLGGTIVPRYMQALKFWWVAGGWVEFAIVKSVTLPARPYLGLSADNRVEIVDATEDWLSRLVQ